jgi:hypothetical protein
MRLGFDMRLGRRSGHAGSAWRGRHQASGPGYSARRSRPAVVGVGWALGGLARGRASGGAGARAGRLGRALVAWARAGSAASGVVGWPGRVLGTGVTGKGARGRARLGLRWAGAWSLVRGAVGAGCSLAARTQGEKGEERECRVGAGDGG